MARIRTIDFLPEIFRTAPNKQFLSSTLDQLVQNPKLKQTQGYIGRRVGPGVNPDDSYVLEPTKVRSDYQLEPGVVFLKDGTNTVLDALTYPGLIDSINVQGGITTRQDRLFGSEYYVFDPFVDYDKMVNFGQYFWLPNGPDAVDVSSTDVPIIDQFNVTRSETGYEFSGIAGTNPVITLARQGNYEFNVDQLGNGFYIQSVPGTAGTLPYAPTQSSREVMGVGNNGEDVGTVTFDVPTSDAQNFYFTLTNSGSVSFATSLEFNQIDGQPLETFLTTYGGIDGIMDLNGRTLIFLGDNADGWDTDDFAIRYGLWQINIVNIASVDYITLSSIQTIPELSKLMVQYGNTYASISFYKNAEGYYQRIPLITADLETLYYQDANNPLCFGRIRLIDTAGADTIDIDDIIDHANYTSPNGVVFTNGLKVRFQSLTTPASYSGNEYYVEGVGQAIKLVPVDRLIVPETYSSNTSGLYTPETPDYITINRASFDYNPWSRSNRWFHIDVILATASYNNTVPVVNNSNRAQRPILEFRPNIRLFGYGTDAILPIDIIDYQVTDAMSDINGTEGYTIDGYSLEEGTRIIFAADTDTAVRNKVFVVSFISPGGDSTPIIDLQPADIYSPSVLVDQCAVCLKGNTLEGKSFYYDGVEWIPAQQKISVNQPPLFNIFDINGVSLADRDVYPSSTFTGTKLFSYAVGTGMPDKVIGQPLKYQTINNVGDIVFDNNLYLDTFVYVENTVGITSAISAGIVRQYLTRTTFEQLLGWQTAYSERVSYQEFKFTYSGIELILDVPVSTDSVEVPIKLYAGSTFLDPGYYTYTVDTTTNQTTIFISDAAVSNGTVTTGTIIEVQVISDVASEVGFYTVPLNLENNPLNEDLQEITLGTVRNHYGTICQNLKTFSGHINGANNTRDLGNIVPYGQVVLQQSSPLTLAGTFLHSSEFDYSRSIAFNATQYQKYKDSILNTVTQLDVYGKTAAQVLDEAMAYLNVGKTQSSPFYWSDMVPSGEIFVETNYTITPISTDTFDTYYTYNFTSANYRGLLVYLNGVQLVGDDHEYAVAVDGPRITILVPLNIGDVITLREYTQTYGNFVPNTPTKLGLYSAYVPQLFLDDTYTTPTWVIQGHDGSITIAFEDFRDDVLLEFEKRIYNNLKTEHKLDIVNIEDVIPGQFRKTEYTLSEVNQILNTSFLAWSGANKLDYRAQEYSSSNEFTWNYSLAENKLNGDTLLGNWRGIYQYFYDTNYPHIRPWEMLGFSEEPAWWQLEYGPAPYTSGNLVLWDDLALGLVKDPAGPYILPRYARPGLQNVIPVDSEGNLLSPMEVMVGNYDVNGFRKSWVPGDDGPVEASWRRSSYYPFAIQRLLALTKPAKYFALGADRDLYSYNNEFNQYLYDNRYRIDPALIQVYGNGTSKASYIDWIVDYNRQAGLDSTVELETRLKNIDVRLCYRMASYSDKQYIKIFTEKSSPDSTNTSLLLPDESFQLSLYQNPTFDTITWSSIIVQRTELGYVVYGYSTVRPYFEILVSQANGSYTVVEAGNKVVRVNNSYSNNVVQVPYGYEFVGESSVVDFIMSYGRLMEQQGMVFDSVENNTVLNWNQMAQEFLYWTQQGWGVGSIINLNPAADRLSVVKPNAIVEPLNAITIDDILLNQNKQPLIGSDYVVDRIDNTLTLTGVNNQTFNYLYAKFTAYENIIVFDNTSIFNDLIYKPLTGARQSRLLFTGYTTYDWNGQLDAQGFILNQDDIYQWQPNTSYSKGQIVLYKDSYWAAAKLLPPSETFVFSDWIKSDYNQIQKGLLPNIATKDELIRNFYDTYSANLERDADLLSFGLIGFRPRQYMSALDLDDISQVNLYQQFIGIKGSRRAVELFRQAKLDKEVAEYQVYENWAVQSGTYGATASRAFVDFRLNQSLLQSNPATIQVINPQESSIANQTILVNDIWKQSYKITSPDILPIAASIPPDAALPTAGYVNYDDVPIKSFDFASLGQAITDYTNLVGEGRLLVGTPIWVAKINEYNWGIYRTNLTPGLIVSVKDNLNGTSTVTFSQQHGLSITQKIIIKHFNNEVDGVYDVLSVPSLYTITIAFGFTGESVSATGEGLCFYLGTMRVQYPNQIASLPYVDDLRPGAQVWVDNIGNGTWAVYNKTDPFAITNKIQSGSGDLTEGFGYSVAQGFEIPGAVIGAPGYNDNQGGVYGYGIGLDNEYVQNAFLSLAGTLNVKSYGFSADAGSYNWAVAGAPFSEASRGYITPIYRDLSNGDFVQAQLIVPEPATIYTATGDGSTTSYNISGTITETNFDVLIKMLSVVVDNVVYTYEQDWSYVAPNVVFGTAPADGAVIDIFLKEEAGYSVTISPDEYWIYVGAPDANRVLAYAREDVQIQSVNYVGDGTTTTFSLADTVIVNPSPALGETQFGVTVNNIPRVLNTDYVFDGSGIVFTTPPNVGDKVRIARRQSASFSPVVPTTDFDVSSIYTVTDEQSITVYYNSTILRPFLDYTYDSLLQTVTLTNSVSSGSVVIVSGSHYRYVDTFTVAELDTYARLGHSVSSGNNGSQIFAGAPGDIIDNVVTGSSYYFDRSIERFLVTDASVNEYTTTQVPAGPVYVTLNGEFLVKDNGFNNNSQYSVVGSTVTIDVALTLGDIIEVSTDYFTLVQQVLSSSAQNDKRFGWSVDTCPTNCTEYIGAPGDNTDGIETGSAERWINKPRQFGVITSTNQDPTLTPGDTLRINNYPVTVALPTAWSGASAYGAGVYVSSGSDIYYSIAAVPVGTSLSDTNYWELSTWVNCFAQTIIDAGIPNVTASVSNGYLTINVVNIAAATPFEVLMVLPGQGNVFEDLGFDIFIYSQTAFSPNPVDYAHFGSTVYAAKNNVTLVVGAPDGEAREATTFDGDTTTFDYNTTKFYAAYPQSGVAYSYDYVGVDPTGSLQQITKFVFGQQLYDSVASGSSNFGQSISYVGENLLIGAPGIRSDDSTFDSSAFNGQFIQFRNPGKKSAWQVEHAQLPMVDVTLLNSIYTYDRIRSGVTQYLDFIDPIQGKILGAARQNIDFLGALDPAFYNVGDYNNIGSTWGPDHVGKIWWDLSTVRFVDYHQGDLQYSSRRWSQLFPGSTVDIYQWIVSDVPPSSYTGPGTVHNTANYSVSSVLDTNNGHFITTYYYWVKNIPEVATAANKTLSTTSIAQYIDNPRSSGIPYAAALSSSAIALYNTAPYVIAQDTILSVNFDRIRNNDNIHVEYDLIADGNPDSFVSTNIYRKMLDSFCGQDTLGNLVPDPMLSPAERYGVEFRPRQSMFVDRYNALKNYLTRANSIMALYPLADATYYPLLESSDPEPSAASGLWNKRVLTYEELTWQDIRAVPLGYRYLVAVDETVENLWTIYEVNLIGTTRELSLYRVESYDTRKYWNYIDWVKVGYNNNVKPLIEVTTYADLLRLTPYEGLTAKVTRNSYNKYEIYQYASGSWNRVVLEDGTIEIDATIWDYSIGHFGFDVEVFDAQRFDEAPITETRQILRSLNEEIFVNNLAIYRNQLLILTFNYVMNEQVAPNWLFKTSLIDVNHKIRDLLPYQIYRRDNQDFVIDYIKEVKPYHVQIREFNLRYDGSDTFQGSLTDFDVPAEYDTTYNQFVSPILDNSEYPQDPASDRPDTWAGWQTWPYSQWYQNYKLVLDSIEIIDQGQDYTVEPVVEVSAVCDVLPTLRAVIDSLGHVVDIIIDNPGSGYLTTPIITLVGGNGTGARAAAVLDNPLVRSFKTTIVYNRCEYTSNVLDWTENTDYVEGDLVRYNNQLYVVDADINSGTSFDPDYYTKADPSTLSAANRVMGLYNPSVNEPGLELALVINGIDYPGVQVMGPNFNQDTGFDVGNYDINPYDNISYGPEGKPTYDPNILDAIYESRFNNLDPYLGIRVGGTENNPLPTYDGDPPNTGSNPILIDGGAFVDTYSSHAPEELVPGATFDTLDFRVYTRPGSDWADNGHGFDINSINFVYTSTITEGSFAELIESPVAIRVVNVTNGVSLIPEVEYTIDWNAQIISVISGANVGDNIEIIAYGIGGGSQLFKQGYNGAYVGESLIVPVAYDEIYEMAILVNGEIVSDYTYEANESYDTVINFSSTYTGTDYLSINVFGITVPQYGYSYPVTEYFTYSSSLSFTLTNSLEGTNPINLIVERNGERLRPAESIEYFGDGSTTGPYYLPGRGLVPQFLIVDSEVSVYVNQELQTLTTDYTISTWDGSSELYIDFVTAPAADAQIIISVSTSADYMLVGDVLTLKATPAVGATIGVTTWDDTAQQDILTQVYQGPTTTGVTVYQTYDETPYSSGDVTDAPGSYDYSAGAIQETNQLDTGREITSPERLWVTKNGYRIFYGEDFVVSTVSGSPIPNTAITISDPILGPGDVVVITSFTQSVVPDSIAFRIFQDMLGNQTLYRITPNSTTELTQALSDTADIIYVLNASNLSEPNLAANIFGAITINGERITYRNRDVINNTVSGLRRGVAGTAIASHVVGSAVYDIGPGEALPAYYQQAVYNNTFYGDGVTNEYQTDLTVDTSDSTILEDAVRVQVGGTELSRDQFLVVAQDPIRVEIFDTPAVGVEVNIYIVQAHVMYAQGAGTASNGVALQEQTTLAAKFIKGQV